MAAIAFKHFLVIKIVFSYISQDIEEEDMDSLMNTTRDQSSKMMMAML